ncbi:transketolase [Albidovulum sediminicola]|uniref:Transketolase n=1 Tax=Albidovulum sediminicola TaxID=2984331 RepID=A0ABT2Z1V8_9RHOB|nr:transketolase [Defluviimonas sp. WL0075]MCV2865085.1 transketolase [Defluviimonas sp. WL0075]
MPNELHPGTDKALANCIRALAIDAVEAAKSGHPGAPMGMADAATVLFARHLKFDALNPDWPDRDRFVLSNGHASMLLYALLHLTGSPDMTMEELRNFRQWGARTAGHPEFGHAPGIETTTGPLGQGLANAVGMALAERILSEEFGGDLVDHRTWVFVGDGCLQEGIGQEAISLAGHLKLGKLKVVYDDNAITIDGATSVSFSEDVPARFRACGWHFVQADGHDHAAIDAALTEAASVTDRPSLIALKTVIGYGAPKKAGTAAAHGSPLGAEEAQAAKQALGWAHPPFEIPAVLLDQWRGIGNRGAAAREAWGQRLASDPKGAALAQRLAGGEPAGLKAAFKTARDALFATPQAVATRRASQIALESLTAALPEMVGGSADLTGSNLTRVKSVEPAFTPDAPGRYIGFGVREFGMAAAMNGMALHGGIIPYGGTFLVFSDYSRNAIRLAALMGVGSIHVMTHDSIGLGEDGPTHQPIEHLASLRAIPNLLVFRPADAVETLECWEIAVKNRKRPSVLALSRQAVPQLRGGRPGLDAPNMSSHGAYVIRSYGAARDVTLLATGTEVSMAVEAAEALAAEGLGVAVVSMPSWELFEAQPAEYRRRTLGTAPRIAVEAAGKFGWTRYVASEDDVIGMNGFGASAPAEVLYEKFGITKDAIIARAHALTGK